MMYMLGKQHARDKYTCARRKGQKRNVPGQVGRSPYAAHMVGDIIMTGLPG
jgi:hypothetical protein